MPDYQYTISLIEMDYHPEVMRNTLGILSGLQCAVNVFTTLTIWQQTKLSELDLPEGFDVYLFDKKEQSIKSFITQHLSLINNASIILFNTMASNFKLYEQLSFEPPVIVRIHNVNSWFQPMTGSYRLRFSVFYLWKDFSHLVRKMFFRPEWYYRKKMINKIDYFAFPNEIIRDYALSISKRKKRKMISLPFSYLVSGDSREKSKGNSEHIFITLPGKIDKRTRDFMGVYNAFKKLTPWINSTNKQVTLVLLGSGKSGYGKRVIRKFSSLCSEHFTLVHFNDFIEQDVFLEYIEKTDFFLLPININTRFTIYEEKYGTSKLSGSINEMIAGRKPAIITSQYPLDESLKKVTETYESSYVLSETIKNWCETQKFKEFDTEAAFRPYNPAIIQKEYDDFIRGVISKRENI